MIDQDARPGRRGEVAGNERGTSGGQQRPSAEPA
jgi:hypothetical protein